MKTKDIVFCGVVTALMCVLCPLSVPVYGIPITLSTFIIYTVAAVFEPKISLITVLLYILTGCVGLPVFSGYCGGISHILGPSGGFILGYVPLVITVSLMHRSIAEYIMGMLIGTLILYGCGCIGYGLATGSTLATIIYTCVLPFLPCDMIKIILAASIAPRIKRIKCKY